MTASDNAAIAEFCRIDAERAQARLARLEKQEEERDTAELVRLSALGAGACPPLSCQCNNISRKAAKSYCVSNKNYYDKSAVALQNNVARWVLDVGRRYLPDGLTATPAAIEACAREHLAEFTITIPHNKAESPQDARRRFTAAFNEFNRRFLKERASRYFGDFVRVFEPHKDGVLHAHILIECKQSLRRGGLAFKWRKFKGAYFVKGETVADWVRKIWAEFRGGGLEPLGIGKIHTLQPIRKGVKEFSFYVAKYITKNLTARPQFMRGLRVVAYSRGFLGGLRLKVYDSDKSERIAYFSKKYNCTKWRYKRFSTFSINCPSTRARGQKLLAALRAMFTTFETARAALGSRWAWALRPIVNAFKPAAAWLQRATKWERLAAFAGLLGDKFKAVLRFGKNLLRYEDFLKIDSKGKSETDFEVVGFIDNAEFVPLKTAVEAAHKLAAEAARNMIHKLKVWRTRADLDRLYDERRERWNAYNAGKIGNASWRQYLENWLAREKEFNLTNDWKLWDLRAI